MHIITCSQGFYFAGKISKLRAYLDNIPHTDITLQEWLRKQIH
jgi:hypothetical protein